jgi:RNA methyltransferase, TrmH family
VPLERFCASGSGLPGIEVEAKLLSAAAGLASGTRTLALYEARWAPEVRGPLAVYLHGVTDPGNVGTVLRSAHAFDAGSVAIGPSTADPFSPHAVRASMGAIFAVPVARCGGIAELPGIRVALDADAAGDSLADTLAVIAAAGGAHPDDPDGAHSDVPDGAHSGVPDGAHPDVPRGSHPDAVQHPPEITLIVGAERAGLPEEVLRVADHVARIPIATHSLNAAMAATVALYEARRTLGEATRMAPP